MKYISLKIYVLPSVHLAKFIAVSKIELTDTSTSVLRLFRKARLLSLAAESIWPMLGNDDDSFFKAEFWNVNTYNNT